MISAKLFAVLIILFFSNYLIGQDTPKNIIVIEEEDLNFIDKEDSSNQENKNRLNNKQKSIVDNETPIKKENKDNFVVVDDIEKEFNEWYGILSSEEGGFGWLMWGQTRKDYALSLLKKTNFKSKTTSLNKLTINFLLSRAKAPKLDQTDLNQYVVQKADPFTYLKEQIKVLSEIGDVRSIDMLLNSIPLELKQEGFQKDITFLRKGSINIPNICKKTLDKKYNSNQNLEKRKNLIACNIALKKFNQALLAIDLLENDSIENLSYTALAREVIETTDAKNITNLSIENDDSINFKIMSLIDYEVAKTLFTNETIILDQLVYNMKLYEKEDQIRALERLVERGIYDIKVLEKAYVSFYNFIQDNSINKPLSDLEKDNSLMVRIKLYNLVNNSISNLERAKYLNLLWKKAEQIGIEKSIYKLTANIILSLNKEPELSWFIFPATKALIVSNKLEQAKSWLFFLSEDLYNRASLDIKFCKYLVLLYLKDNNLNNQDYNIPEINFLLKRLTSSLDVNKVELLRILISLKSLGYEVDDRFLKIFYIQNFMNGSASTNLHLENLYFNLDVAVKNKNIAETILISLNLLNNINKENLNYYQLYKPLNSLFELGLKQYVRDFVLEFNLDSFH